MFCLFGIDLFVLTLSSISTTTLFQNFRKTLSTGVRNVTCSSACTDVSSLIGDIAKSFTIYSSSLLVKKGARQTNKTLIPRSIYQRRVGIFRQQTGNFLFNNARQFVQMEHESGNRHRLKFGLFAKPLFLNCMKGRSSWTTSLSHA